MSTLSIYKYKTIAEKCKIIFGLFFISFLVFSSFTQYFYMNMLGMGFCMIEVSLIIFLVFNSSYIKLFNFKDCFVFIALIAGLFVLAVLSLKSYQVPSLIQTFRSYYLFFVGYELFRWKKSVNWDIIYLVFFIAIIADIIASVIIMNSSIRTGDVNIMVLNILLPSFVICYSANYRPKWEFWFAIIISFIAAFTSVTRGLILYNLILVFLVIFFTQRPIRKIKILLYSAIFFLIAYNLYFKLESYVEFFSANMHYRLYTKVLDHDNSSNGDEDRLGHLTYVIDHIDECVIPHGLATRQSNLVDMKKERLLWSIRDCSLNELIYTFGVIGFIVPVMLLFFSYKLYKKKSDDRINIVLSFINLVLILYIFLGYGLFTFPPTIFTLGIYFGATRKNLNLSY